MANKDIRRIQDDWAGASASLTEGKTALLNDVDSECHVFKINGKVFFPAIATSWDGTSYTYLNGKFGGLILGQSQNNTISVDSSTNTLIISNDTTGDVHIRAIAGELKLSNYNNDPVTLDSSNNLNVNGLIFSPTGKLTVAEGGYNSETAVEINVAGKSRVEVYPDGTNQYYTIVGESDGQLLFIRNVAGVSDAYIDSLALAASEKYLYILDDDIWRTI
jgi:hypothetical protein